MDTKESGGTILILTSIIIAVAMLLYTFYEIISTRWIWIVFTIIVIIIFNVVKYFGDRKNDK